MTASSQTSKRAKDKLANKAVTKAPKSLTHATSDKIHGLLDQYKAQISQAIPRHLTVERVIQLATTVIARTPAIKECTTESIIGAVMQASVLGLDISPTMGECYLIPRKNSGRKEANFEIGYRGYIKLMRNSPEVSNVYAHVVHDEDYFDYRLGLNPDVDHRPVIDGIKGELRAAYAIVKFTDGSFIVEVMNKGQIEAVRDKSEGKGSGYSPWSGPFVDQMWRKSPLRRISKFVPLMADKAEALSVDGAVIRPDMFDQKTKQLRYEKAELIDYEQDEPEVEKPTQTQKSKKSTKTEDAPDEWLLKANKLKKTIEKKSSPEEFTEILGSLGFEDLESVDAASRDNVMMGMVKTLNALLNSSDVPDDGSSA